ncbi:glycosyltransferase family 4 protein [Bacillus sp. FJAT-52991]|uniref:Glycosyltransferase family 4 protein n=1 Tax=Bacillus kandeliae TaxID=3129297 RepID=A0ABZ2N6Y5_9BACI
MIQPAISKQKVAFVASIYGHLAAFHQPFMKWFQEQGFEVHAYGHEDAGKKEIKSLGVVCHDIPFQRSPYHLDNIQALKEITRSFKTEAFQVVHVHTPVASVLGRIAAKRNQVPCVLYTAHGFHFFKGAPWKNWLTFYLIEKLMARHTDYLVTINQEDYIRAKKFPVRKEVLFVRGVGVDSQTYKVVQKNEVQNKRKQLGLTPDDFVIACVAELNDNKNQVQLIKAVYRLVKDYPMIKCLLIGSGKEEFKLRKMVQTMDLHENVRFLGFRKDIPELMELADVVTLLSKREGLPRALMEGLVAGKPLVVTDVRGNSDLVVNGKNGFVVKVGDIAATATAFEHLMVHREDLQVMGKMSAQISKQYDLSIILKEMANVYQKAIISAIR